MPFPVQFPSGSLQEIRPGRNLFVQKVILGSSPSPETPQDASTAAATVVNLICVHGTCASHQQFQKLLEVLQFHLEKKQQQNSSGVVPRTVLQCYLFDAVGCGQSPALDDWNAYRTSEAVLDLQALLQKIQQEQKGDIQRQSTILLGHSYGPNVILKLLHLLKTDPNESSRSSITTVSGVILMSTALKDGPFPLQDGGHPIMKLPVIVLQCLQPTMTKEFIRLAYHPDTPTSVIEANRRSSNGNSMWVAKAYHRHHEWITSEEAKQAMTTTTTTISGNRIPCLVLHGTTDGILPLESGRHVADQLQAEFVSVEPASHQIMEEQPDQVAQAILLFLQPFFRNDNAEHS